MKDFAAKLIWHWSRRELSGGFIILSRTPLSNDARELVERVESPFSIFDWTGERFILALQACPNTVQKWFGGGVQTPVDLPTARNRLFNPLSLGFEVEQPLEIEPLLVWDPPYQYAYFERDGHFQRWPTDYAFMHTLRLFNRSRQDVVVRSIRLRPVSFAPLPSRVVVLFKPKGIYDPLRLEYMPPIPGDRENELLAPRALRLVHREHVLVNLELDQSCSPGCYEFQLMVTYDSVGRTTEWEGATLRVCVCVCGADGLGNRAPPETLVLLHCFGRHYDSLAREVLGCDPSDWNRLLCESDTESALVLGPTLEDRVAERRGDWEIRKIPIQRRGDYFQFALESASLLLSLDGKQEPPLGVLSERNEFRKAFYGVDSDTYLRWLEALAGDNDRSGSEP